MNYNDNNNDGNQSGGIYSKWIERLRNIRLSRIKRQKKNQQFIQDKVDEIHRDVEKTPKKVAGISREKDSSQIPEKKKDNRTQLYDSPAYNDGCTQLRSVLFRFGRYDGGSGNYGELFCRNQDDEKFFARQADRTDRRDNRVERRGLSNQSRRAHNETQTFRNNGKGKPS